MTTRALVTGGAGFIGSNLVDRLLALGWTVTALDNLTTGNIRFLETALTHSRFRFIQGDILHQETLLPAMQGIDVVFHLAANADVRFGTRHPALDLEQNTLGTFRVLEGMRLAGTRKIVFASTGSVYGEAPVIPTPETCPFPIQTSLYGASKLAAEGLIQAFCEGFGFQGYIFRFVSILGERYTHGHVIDFYSQLVEHPDHLHLLGDGRQRKSYLYVGDCIQAILAALGEAKERVNIFNLGTDEFCEVTESAGWIAGHIGCDPKLTFSGGDRGWIGDNPFIFLDCARIKALGWGARFSIREAVLRTVDYLAANPWVREVRR